MNIVEKRVSDLIPYANNPRNNVDAVDAVAASIAEFGFKVPMVIDSRGVIVAGHTRLLAARRLGLETVPCVIADDLTDAQIKAFRLADNRVAEIAAWDPERLDLELQDLTEIDMEPFGFGARENEWFNREDKNDRSAEEGNDEYNNFIDKFVPKKTTDDCYTPDIVYDAIADWVAREYKVQRKGFVRPFYPGGDYQNERYPKGCVVVDNPPFSILSEIIKWYDAQGIKFFLFAPALTLFSSSSSSSSSSCACALACGADITYENGASINTSFVTNLEDNRARSVPDLYKIVKAANDKNQEQYKRNLPKYRYPDEVLTAAMLNYMSNHDTSLTIRREDSHHIRHLDSQKEYNDSTIYGSGYLLSEKAAAEKAAAEKAAAEKAAAHVWELSEREKEIIKSLGEKNGDS